MSRRRTSAGSSGSTSSRVVAPSRICPPCPASRRRATLDVREEECERPLFDGRRGRRREREGASERASEGRDRDRFVGPLARSLPLAARPLPCLPADPLIERRGLCRRLGVELSVEV